MLTPTAEPAPRPQQIIGFDDLNRSNDPIENSAAFNIQDQYTPDYANSSIHTNDVLLRGTQPLAPGSVIPYPQLMRLTVPISTRPDPDGGYTTGLGDIELFDIFLPGSVGNFSFGVGPLITFPTASEDELGADKWQAGLAGIGVSRSETGVFGALAEWQTSFAGSGDEDVQTLTAQPFLIFNLPGAWYLRSTAEWSFDLESGDHYIPVGLGVGKAWNAGNITYNLFVEPQWTVEHQGDFLPETSLFFGLNMTIGG
jgi:hypothetical protein